MYLRQRVQKVGSGPSDTREIGYRSPRRFCGQRAIRTVNQRGALPAVVTQDEIDQLRHDAANAVQKLDAAQKIVLRAITAIELKQEAEAKRILHGLLDALQGETS